MKICVTNMPWIPNHHQKIQKENTVNYSKPSHNKGTNLHTISIHQLLSNPTPLHPVELSHQHHDNRYHQPYLWGDEVAAGQRLREKRNISMIENGCVTFCCGKHWETHKNKQESVGDSSRKSVFSHDVCFMKMMKLDN